MEAFIELIRIHPCLWNPTHPEYRELNIKDDTWRIVVNQLNSSSITNIHTAKIEWKKLRDNHRDALKRAKLGKNKLLPAHITTWKYAKAMQFLEPYMKYRITENIEMDPVSVNSSEPDVSTTETPEATHDSSNKRRCVVEQRPKESPPKIRQEPDSLQCFFNCILQSTREMPQWMQTQVKKKIFAVIIEAEELLSAQEATYTNHQEQGPSERLVFDTKVKTEMETEYSSDI